MLCFMLSENRNSMHTQMKAIMGYKPTHLQEYTRKPTCYALCSCIEFRPVLHIYQKSNCVSHQYIT